MASEILKIIVWSLTIVVWILMIIYWIRSLMFARKRAKDLEALTTQLLDMLQDEHVQMLALAAHMIKDDEEEETDGKETDRRDTFE